MMDYAGDLWCHVRFHPMFKTLDDYATAVKKYDIITRFSALWVRFVLFRYIETDSKQNDKMCVRDKETTNKSGMC